MLEVGTESYSVKPRHFSREFKRDTVQLVTEKDMPVGKGARELNIHPNLLHSWRRKLLAEGTKALKGKGRIVPEKAEIRRLRKELKKVREEKDILKKPWHSLRTPSHKTDPHALLVFWQNTEGGFCHKDIEVHRRADRLCLKAG